MKTGGALAAAERLPMKTALVLGALATLVAAGAATAHVPLDLTPAGQGIYYLPNPTESRDHGVWKETNGLDGLQEEETLLPDGTIVPADALVLG